MIRSVTKPFHGTWCEDGAWCWQYLTNTSTVCERVIVHFWDSGKLEMRHVKGDGRKGNFKEFDRLAIPFSGDREAARQIADGYAAERLNINRN